MDLSNPELTEAHSCDSEDPTPSLSAALRVSDDPVAVVT